jgi:hypothetical protein
MRIFVLVILFITSCQTFQKKPLTFLSVSNLSFQTKEDSLSIGAKVNDNIVYTTHGDSFLIGEDYKSIVVHTNWWFRNHVSSYYLPHSSRPGDIILLHFYKKELCSIEVYSKQNTDSLLRQTEQFFNCTFPVEYSSSLNNRDSSKYGIDYKGFEDKPTREQGYFSKGKILVHYDRDRVYNEVRLSLYNHKVELPPWCGTKTPWWYDLVFWRW